MELLSRLIFGAVSIILMLLALGLVIYGALDLITVLQNSAHNARNTILNAIGSIVIAIAVFDYGSQTPRRGASSYRC